MRMPACLIAALLAGAAPATAAPFTWVAEGAITGVNRNTYAGPYVGAFSIGQTYRWSITMDSEAPDHMPGPACGFYTPITSMTFTSGPMSWATTTRPGQDYFVNPQGSGSCDVPLEGTIRIRSDFGTGLFLSMHLYGTRLTDALPVSAAGIGWGSLDFLVGGPGSPFGLGIATGSATITSSADHAVPEPAGLLMLGLLYAWRKRRLRLRASRQGS